VTRPPRSAAIQPGSAARPHHADTRVADNYHLNGGRSNPLWPSPLNCCSSPSSVSRPPQPCTASPGATSARSRCRLPSLLDTFRGEPHRFTARRTGWLVWRTDGCCVRPIYVSLVWHLGWFIDWLVTRTVNTSLASIPIRNGRLWLLCLC
jgi:hypothetical protein